MNRKKGQKPKETKNENLVEYKDLERNIRTEIAKEIYDDKSSKKK